MRRARVWLSSGFDFETTHHIRARFMPEDITRSGKRFLKWMSCLGASLALLAVVGYFVVLPSVFAWFESREVAEMLREARSVTIVEFARHLDFSSPDPLGKEVVFQRIVATPDQIERFRAATAGFVSLEEPRAHDRCFTPHHRLEIVRRDGSTASIEICFLCPGIKLTPGAIFRIPGRWTPALREYFTSVGMPPATYAEYEERAAARRSAATGETAHK